MKRRKMLVADLLCGAGGSSTGCQRALRELGLDMELVCVNHWDTAIATHEKNHPEARHFVQDIATVRPHMLVPEGYLDLLMASPTCTHHSVARGGKPTSDQQRSDPWHIITWLTELRVKRIIIENVWEFISWGPVDRRTGKPVKSRKGEYFHAWIQTIKGLGFEPEWRKLNAADYGDATTRQRFILMARSDRKKVAWPMPTHRKPSALKGDMFAQEKPWRPARDIIDWDIRGKSIFTRKKPLAEKTLARIYAGAVKFQWPEPYLVILRNHMAARGLDLPLPTIAANGTHIGIAQPVVVNMKGKSTASSSEEPLPTQTAHAPHLFSAEPVVVRSGMTGSNGAGAGARSTAEPLATMTSSNGLGVAEPVIMNGRKGNQAKPVSQEPVPTLDTKGGVWLAEPIVLSQHGGGAPRSAEEPLPTITTGGAGTDERTGCARPMLVTVAHGNDPKEKDPNSRRANSVDDPLGAIHGTGASHALVMSYYGNTHWCHSPDDPLATITAKERHGMVTPVAKPMIAPYYGSGSGENCTDSEEPLPTVTAKGRFGMVVPVTNSNGGAQARNTETDPLPTSTTEKGGEFGLVLPVTHAGGENRVKDVEEPLPTVTGANRGELAFITAQHGERPGQAPRVHDVDKPTPTIAATGHVDLIEGAEGFDILFRMLEPHELAAAMGFNTEEAAYEFAGTKTEKIKQIGNAVSVAKMKACVSAIMADAAPKQEFLEAAE